MAHGAGPAGPSSTATLPPSTVIVTVRSGGMSQSRSVQTASAMARLCASSVGSGRCDCGRCGCNRGGSRDGSWIEFHGGSPVAGCGGAEERVSPGPRRLRPDDGRPPLRAERRRVRDGWIGGGDRPASGSVDDANPGLAAGNFDTGFPVGSDGHRDQRLVRGWMRRVADFACDRAGFGRDADQDPAAGDLDGAGRERDR